MLDKDKDVRGNSDSGSDTRIQPWHGQPKSKALKIPRSFASTTQHPFEQIQWEHAQQK